MVNKNFLAIFYYNRKQKVNLSHSRQGICKFCYIQQSLFRIIKSRNNGNADDQFRSLTGRTPIDYLNYYRIECAIEMLSTKDITPKKFMKSPF